MRRGYLAACVRDEIAAWLGLDPAAFPAVDTASENRTTGYKSAGLQKVALAGNDRLERIFRRHPGVKRTLRSLYYRVNGISVRLPALRERDDLGQLAQGLLAKLGAPEARLDDELFALLADYHWPGNIRQLEMVLRTALAMREPGENTLGLEHLPDSTLEELAAGERQPCGRIRETEMELIRQALDRHQGNVSAAADALGISRATLYRKLKQLKGG